MVFRSVLAACVLSLALGFTPMTAPRFTTRMDATVEKSSAKRVTTESDRIFNEAKVTTSLVSPLKVGPFFFTLCSTRLSQCDFLNIIFFKSCCC